MKSDFFNPKEKLLTALSKIESFTTGRRKNGRGVVHFIPALFSGKIRKKLKAESQRVEREVFRAIEDVKRFHPIVNHNKDSQLAERARRAVAEINGIIENMRKNSGNWSDVALTFMSRKGLLPFSRAHKVSLPPEEKMPRKIRDVVGKRELATPLSTKELDLFRMKAISHIRKHSELFFSVRDILASVKNNPIYLRKLDDDPGCVTLEQTFSPFPGETIIFRGSVKNRAGEIFSIPRNFAISFVSEQTGFPYPLQHSGWALANPLVARLSLHPENFPKLSALLLRKEKAASELAKRGPMLQRAKDLLLFKSREISGKREEFLGLHKKLVFTFLNSAKFKTSRDAEIISAFFKRLENEKQPHIQIAKIYQQFNESQIFRPYAALEKAWLKESEKGLFSVDPKHRLATARKILVKNCVMLPDLFPEANKFLEILRSLFSPALHEIILRNFAEIIDFPPPELAEFTKALRAVLYTQQECFLEELKGGAPRSYLENLSSDIETLDALKTDHPICLELNRGRK